MKKVDKPWGNEIWWAHAKDKYMGKIINIKQGHRLSLQYHQQKEETIYVLSGRLKLTYSETRDGEIKQCISRVHILKLIVPLGPDAHVLRGG